ncbi:hypothetical protein GC163_16905 [bacterium]|nr:hypothetical protein [bacterium]
MPVQMTQPQPLSWWQRRARELRNILAMNFRLFREFPKLYFAGLTILFGVIAYVQIEREVDRGVYQIVQLFILEASLPEVREDFLSLKLARMSAVIFFVLTVWAGIRKVFADSFTAFRLRMADQHDIVCGLGDVGQQLVKDLRATTHRRSRWQFFEYWCPRLVVIERDADHPAVMEWRRLGVLVIAGDATDVYLQTRTNFPQARRMFVCTGSDDVNIEIVFDWLNDVQTIAEAESTQPPASEMRQCFVQLHDTALCEAVFKHASQQARASGIDLRPFSVLRNIAQQFVLDHLVQHAPQTSDDTLLVFILGGEAFAEELTLQIGALAHFRNCRRTRVVVALPQADAVRNRCLARHGTLGPAPADSSQESVHISRAVDEWGAHRLRPLPYWQTQDSAGVVSHAVEYVVNLTFADSPGYPVDESFWGGWDASLADPHVQPVIVISLPEDRQSFDVAMQLSERMSRVHARPVPVYLRLAKQPAFSKFLSTIHAQDSQRPLAIPFGSYEKSVRLNTLSHANQEQLAKQFHQDYQSHYCGTDRIGSCADWERLATTYRQANESAALHALIKLHSLKMRHVSRSRLSAAETSRIVERPEPEEIELLAKMEHNRWMADRLLDGWRWGPVRDEAGKQRPQLVPWQFLSEEERDKDRTQVLTIFRVLNSDQMCVIRDAIAPKRTE